MHKESGEGWSRSYADAVEFEYRRFLYLVKKFPHEQAAPLFDVDVFWHYHILDTMKYAADCEAVFGYFLHHFPYVGLRGEQDLEAHHRVGERMRELYEHTYGEQYVRQEDSTYSSESGKAASSRLDSVAWSVPTAKFESSRLDSVAWSVPTAQSASPLLTSVAWSIPTAKFASSIMTDTSGSPALAMDGADFDASALAAANFYSERPSLSRTA
jgi:hypothetical protein